MDAWKNQLFFGDNLEILRSGRIAGQCSSALI
jgi:hypothetical protein